MLYKKIYIMKGNDGVKSVLKLTLVENGFTELELNTHYAYGESYTFILKSGVFVHVESFDGRYLKRRFPPFDPDGLLAAVCYNGKILCMTAPTPYAPMELLELSQKYSVIKVDNIDQNKADYTEAEENTNLENERLVDTTESVIEEALFVNKNESEPVDSESDNHMENNIAHDISNDYNILGIVPDEEMNDKNDFRALASEIEQKYDIYPHNEALEQVFPGSKWIKGDGSEPSLGLLYDSTEITHICYAKSGDEPFDDNASFYDGYWVVFENIM